MLLEPRGDLARCKLHYFHYADQKGPELASADANARFSIRCHVCSYALDVQIGPQQACNAVAQLVQRTASLEPLRPMLDLIRRYCDKAPDAIAKGTPFGTRNERYGTVIAPHPEALALLRIFGFQLRGTDLVPPESVPPELAAHWRRTLRLLYHQAGYLQYQVATATQPVRALPADRSADAALAYLAARLSAVPQPPAATRASIATSEETECLSLLGLTEAEASDEAVAWAFALLSKNPVVPLTPTLANLLYQSLTALATGRRSASLLALMHSPSVLADAAYARSLVALGADFADDDSTIVMRFYEAHQQLADGSARDALERAMEVAATQRRSAELERCLSSVRGLDSPLAAVNASPAAAAAARRATAFPSLTTAAASNGPWPFDAPASLWGEAPPSPLARAHVLPAGLHNIGQTCYCNALLQALFSLTPLVRSVLSLPPSLPPASPDTARHSHAFLYALQRLWAFQAAGSRQAYNPACVMQTLRTGTGERRRVGGQEDVHEALLLLLSQACEGDAAARCRPLADDASIDDAAAFESLLFGLADEASARRVGPRLELSVRPTKFAHIGVDVAHGSLYASLEAASASVAVTPDLTVTTSFRRLPPVLVFLLGRAVFDAGALAGRKINTPFAFPTLLCMDAFTTAGAADANAAAARRAAAEELCARAAACESALEDICAALAAAGDAPAALARASEALGSAALASLLEPSSLAAATAALDTVAHQLALALASRRAAIADAHAALAALYAHGRERFALHAVVVHRGAASAGHYYTCVRRHCAAPAAPDAWLRLDDARVGLLSEDDVMRAAHASAAYAASSGAASMAGAGASGESAYALVYVREPAAMAPLAAHEALAALDAAGARELADAVRAHNAACA